MHELVGRYAGTSKNGEVATVGYCPVLENPNGAIRTGIGYNHAIGSYNDNTIGHLVAARQQQFAFPGRTLLLADSGFSTIFDSLDPARPWGQGTRYEHNLLGNSVFVDGHAAHSQNWLFMEQAKVVTRAVR